MFLLFAVACKPGSHFRAWGEGLEPGRLRPLACELEAFPLGWKRVPGRRGKLCLCGLTCGFCLLGRPSASGTTATAKCNHSGRPIESSVGPVDPSSSFERLSLWVVRCICVDSGTSPALAQYRPPEDQAPYK